MTNMNRKKHIQKLKIMSLTVILIVTAKVKNGTYLSLWLFMMAMGRVWLNPTQNRPDPNPLETQYIRPVKDLNPKGPDQTQTKKTRLDPIFPQFSYPRCHIHRLVAVMPSSNTPHLNFMCRVGAPDFILPFKFFSFFFSSFPLFFLSKF